MKRIMIVWGLFIATAGPAGAAPVPHLDPEMSGAEYRLLLEGQGDVAGILGAGAEDPALDEFLARGKRNLDWVNHVNRSRAPENRISLSSRATQNGYPVGSPRVYNFALIQERWEILRALLPEPLRAVVFDGAPFTDQPPVSEREFSEWLLQVDQAYQIAARYRLMKPYLASLIQAGARDVRGYLALAGTADLDAALGRWSSLSLATQDRLGSALRMICWNAGSSKESCRRSFDAAVSGRAVLDFKKRHFPAAERNYRGFFDITKFRRDADWTAANPGTLRMPFVDPKDATVRAFLEANLHEEWRWGNWGLALDFVPSSSRDTTHIVFVPGSTPHVNGLAGSEITMDRNAPLTEYDVQWTIRHEYGHVLGLPDCYHELYDEELEAFVSYQLDVTNLMCSRRGRLQQKHFDELKRVYFRG